MSADGSKAGLGGRRKAALVLLCACAPALALLSLLPGLAPAVVFGAAAAAALRLGFRHGRAPAPGESAALIVYAALASVVVVTARGALGLMDVPLFAGMRGGEIPLELFRQDPHQSVYEKHDVKLMVGVFFLLFVLYSALLLEGARAAGAASKGRLSAATAAFAFVLFFSVVKLPPYSIDLPHWGPFLASAAGIYDGRWPYLHHYSVQYGLLNSGVLALWLKAVPLTPLGLAALIFSLTAAAGCIAFALIRRLTSSGGAAFLAASSLVLYFHDMDAALLAPNLSALRGHFQITAALALIWAFLGQPSLVRSCAAAFLFGALCLWEPVFGAFMALSFLSVVAYCLATRKKTGAAWALPAFAAGAALPLAIAAAIRPPELELLSFATYGVLFSNHRFFMEGFGSAPQKFYLPELFALAFFMALLLVAYRRLSSGKGFSRRQVFLFATALMSPPWIAYELGNSGPTQLSPLAWLLAPAVALIMYAAYRYSALAKGRVRAYAAVAIAAAPLLTVDMARPLEASMRGYLTKYEQERSRWYRDCAFEAASGGRGCDGSSMPGLAHHLRESSREGFGLGLHGEQGFSYHLPNLFLARACAKGVPIVSNLDAVISLQSGCLPPHRFPSTQHLTAKSMIAEFLKEAKGFPAVVFDDRRLSQYYTAGLHMRMKRDLLDSGYFVAERHGAITVLARPGFMPGGQDCVVCGGESRALRLDHGGGGAWLGEPGFTLRKRLYGAPEWESFVLSALVRSEGPAGVIIGAGSAAEYHVFYISPASGMATLGEYRGPDNRSHRDLFNAALRHKGKAGRAWHDIEVFAGPGGHCQFFVDGEFVAEWAGVKAGARVGLWDWDGTAQFREVMLTRGPEAGAVS